jgi:hypothetical protein
VGFQQKRTDRAARLCLSFLFAPHIFCCPAEQQMHAALSVRTAAFSFMDVFCRFRHEALQTEFFLQLY